MNQHCEHCGIQLSAIFLQFTAMGTYCTHVTCFFIPICHKYLSKAGWPRCPLTNPRQAPRCNQICPKSQLGESAEPSVTPSSVLFPPGGFSPGAPLAFLAPGKVGSFPNKNKMKPLSYLEGEHKCWVPLIHMILRAVTKPCCQPPFAGLLGDCRFLLG